MLISPSLRMLICLKVAIILSGCTNGNQPLPTQEHNVNLNIKPYESVDGMPPYLLLGYPKTVTIDPY